VTAAVFCFGNNDEKSPMTDLKGVNSGAVLQVFSTLSEALTVATTAWNKRPSKQSNNDVVVEDDRNNANAFCTRFDRIRN
jgi:hypothetical protein